ncbi:phytanoyl-CoA dioxygenase family protein [Paenibacillus sp. IB182496]|uniref:Phytanoyl-CoA dioxygenase family protein n=1 Tax=Paenibacillus sabuli TaxID=2772509 RepID=A0A927BPJ7_9BACL|nr:phytanoyl-CoA dioxygenase family protein [Paenibacillus sabuli]MBD2844378.1 phytanoyl-CoA dioxygenase family protein [Paenibacillus sabuli]
MQEKQALRMLDNAQMEQYNRDGYLVLRGVFTKSEMEVVQAECSRFLTLEDYLDPLNMRVGYRKLEDESRVVERFDPVHDISPVFAALTQDERLLTPLRDIYLDEPQLFKDKLIFKLPGVSGYTMHQDAPYWQGFPYEQLISAMVAIDGASAANGGLELFSGYHDRFRTTPGELRNMNEAEIAEIDPQRGTIVETEPGDVILFHSLTPHQSGPNTAEVSRRQLYLTYAPAAAGQLYRAHYQHYQRYSLGFRAGGDRAQGHYFK